MPEETQTTETVEPEGEKPTTPTVEPQEEEFDKERAMATITKLRGFEKSAKALEKENAALKAAEQKRKEAELSEVERLKAQNERIEAELNGLRTNETKRRIASEVGLPEALALRIQGADEATMKTDAETLLEAIPKSEIVKIKETGGNPGSGRKGQETDEERRRRLFG